MADLPGGVDAMLLDPSSTGNGQGAAMEQTPERERGLRHMG